MRKKNEERRQRILDVTAQMIISDGLNGITTAKVAKNAAVPESNIYLYFKNKQDLIRQAFISRKQHLADYLKAHFVQQPLVLDSLTLFGRELYQFANDYPEDLALIQQFYASPILTTLQLTPEETTLNFQFLYDELARGIQNKEIRNVDPTLILKMAYLTITDYAQAVQKHQIDPITTPLSAVLEMVTAAVQLPQ
ncbi:TetR/AcrR family transcriptional regulator [Levilactobacillus brevis]|uniref:TetR/AcrR family transcriptional regulator n=1 Tax=Levilactobacillus brevis TaxID=1580 RepID=UPI001BA83581|nr:TetR/AcrR family transcriptional regulator [Levilactobacillus brevis]MBS1006474.1 TetR/AcrR family transcriptional regulator [Levilactobacillus brevis]MBS1013566.1 TetR/AcrR family transcriptional regulator [Levilactobacillus brevis]